MSNSANNIKSRLGFNSMLKSLGIDDDDEFDPFDNI